MSISSEITRISNAKTAIAESIANKGVTVPSGTKIDGMATLIDSIQTGGGGAVQPSKALTVTSNGTTTITPDAPYDAIKQVDLTVNVASGGGGSEYEACTVRIKGKINSGGMIAYTEFGSGTITPKILYATTEISLSGYMSLTVLKNSLFCLTNITENYVTTGNVVTGTTNNNRYVPFWVTGDCKIDF